MNKHLFFVALAGALAIAGCSSGDSPAPDGGTPDGGQGGSPPDGGHPDGGQAETKHKLVSRPLFGGAPVKNLILDPLVTTDGSLDHFISFVFFPGAGLGRFQPARELVSQAPRSVAFPVADLPTPSSIRTGADRLQVLAPVPGSTAKLEASVWVSAADANGKPVAFADVAHDFTVTILPNDQPTKGQALSLDGKPVKLGARSWVRFAASRISIPEGGWFSMAGNGSKWTFQVQAPEISVAGSDASGRRPPYIVDRDPRDAAALTQYAEVVRQHPRR